MYQWRKCETMSLIIRQIWDRMSEIDGRKLAVSYYKDENESYRVTYGVFRASVVMVQSIVEKLSGHSRQYVLFYGNATHASVCLLLGIVKASCAFVCLDAKLDLDDFKRLIDKLNVNLIFSNVFDDILNNYKATGEDFQLLGERISVRQTGSEVKNDFKFDFVYAVQTSGSTSTPKLVQVPSECILPNILDLSAKLNVQSNDVIALSTPLTFDPSVVELFIAVMSGTSLIVLSPSVKLNSGMLLKVISESGINFYQTTPSIFNNWSEQLKRELLSGRKPKLKTLILGGERFPTNQIKALKPTDVNIYNIYGLTEVSCWASLRRVWPDGDDDVGTPLSETIFDAVREKNDSDFYHLRIGSNSRFCVIDGEELSTPPVFRDTGDIFKLVDSKLYYQGRNDSLIKRFGHRVSLDCIETALSELGLKGVCCLSNGDRLSLFVQKQNKSDGGDVDSSVQLIKTKLKQNQWPDSLHFVDQFPVTPHGKIDKKALLEQRMKSNENTRSIFSTVWSQFSSHADDDDFLAAGGNSFTALQLTEGLKIEGLRVPDDFIVDLLKGASYSSCVQKIVRFNESFTTNDKDFKFKRGVASENPGPSARKNRKTSRIFTRLKGTLNPNELAPAEVEALQSWPSDDNDDDPPFKVDIAWGHDLKKCVDSSPLGAIIDDRSAVVIACSHAGVAAVLDVDSSGRLIAEIQLPDRIESSACLSSDARHFYIGCYDTYLYKIELNSGRVAWKFKTGDIIKTTVVLVDDLIYFGSYDCHVYCISEEAKEKWKTKISGPILAQLLYLKGRVYVNSINGGVYCLEAYTGAVLWEFKISPSFANPVAVRRHTGDELLVCDVEGCVTVLNTANGQSVFTLKLNGQIFATPVISTELSLILFATGLTLQCHRLDSTFTQIWSRQFNSRLVSTPFIFARYILVAETDGTLNFLRLSDGIILATCRLTGEIFSSPIFLKSHVYVGCRDNFLYCVSVNKKPVQT